MCMYACVMREAVLACNILHAIVLVCHFHLCTHMYVQDHSLRSSLLLLYIAVRINT